MMALLEGIASGNNTSPTYDDTIATVIWTLLGTISGIGVLSNVVAFIVLCLQRNKLSVTYWLMALVGVDFATLLFTPMTIVSRPCVFPVNGDNCTGQPLQLHVISTTIQDMFYTIHVLFLIGMSADRYITIARPKSSRNWANKNKALIAIISLTIVSFVTHLPGYAIGIPKPGIPPSVIAYFRNGHVVSDLGHDDVTRDQINQLTTLRPANASLNVTSDEDYGEAARIEIINNLGSISHGVEATYEDEYDVNDDGSNDPGSGPDRFPDEYKPITSSDDMYSVDISTNIPDDGSGDADIYLEETPSSLSQVIRNVPDKGNISVITHQASFKDNAIYQWGYVFGIHLMMMRVIPLLILVLFLCILVSANAQSTRALARKRSTKGRYIANLSGTSIVLGSCTFCVICSIPIIFYELLFRWIGFSCSNEVICQIVFFVQCGTRLLLVSLNLFIGLVADQKFRKDFGRFFTGNC